MVHHEHVLHAEPGHRQRGCYWPCMHQGRSTQRDPFVCQVFGHLGGAQQPGACATFHGTSGLSFRDDGNMHGPCSLILVWIGQNKHSRFGCPQSKSCVKPPPCIKPVDLRSKQSAWRGLLVGKGIAWQGVQCKGCGKKRRPVAGHKWANRLKVRRSPVWTTPCTVCTRTSSSMT